LRLILNISSSLRELWWGGAAWDEYGEHLPKDTVKVCKKSDAILFGSVGGPINKQLEEKWLDCERNAVLGIRKYFDFNVNLRPSKVYKELKNSCVLRADIVEKGIDLLCVRELVGGIYFGKHKTKGKWGKRVASDIMTYTEQEIEKIAHTAFEAAMKRKKKVSSVDKANVLDCSKLWRDVVNRVAEDYPECEYEHILVDNCVMQIISRPYDFDVLLLPNMFGDIVSDEASVLAGSLGMLPSASLNDKGFGMYEPAAGSAPDIAGKGIANPIGQILSAAMMLKYSFNMDEEHDRIVAAVEQVLGEGYRTPDIAGVEDSITTSEMGDLISQRI